ncbi:VapE domain-containing protein [Rufibacter sp. XAAS-G3-1]|uniref:VapE domain-containing protein n=1 Tax=Rufibacter sp. XAAS-G3-1 TaxID=2729134 RepID=UPI0015E71C29|nr:VapE domain-containing protein [Rufibacter sp. XAAS-G3-1]
MSLISLFKNFTQVLEDRPLGGILHSIQDGAYRSQVEAVRSLLVQGKKNEYEQAKKSLPAFTPSGRYMGGRKLEHLRVYSGVVALDLDKVSEGELALAKRIASGEPHTYAAFTSPSGNGLKVLVRVDSGAASHKQAYRQVKEHYAMLLGLRIDESGSDVTRLCFVSWDPDLYLNPEAAVFPVSQQELPTVANAGQRTTGNAGQRRANAAVGAGNTGEPSLEEVFVHCVTLTERRHTYAEGSRNVFVHQLACNLNRYGINQSDALGYLLSDYGYDAQEVRAAVNSAYANTQEHGMNVFRGKYGAGQRLGTTTNGFQREPTPYNQREPTSLQRTPTSGQEFEEDTETEWGNEGLGSIPSPSGAETYIDRIEEFLLARYGFRYNVVTSRQEYRTGAKGRWQPLSDRAESTMLRELKKAQVRVSQAELRMLLSSDFCPLYDPFKTYFNALPSWDGHTDHIGALASTVTTTDQEQWQTCFRKWFVAMVAGVLDEKVVNHTLIVLSGGQGLGKTTWVLNLVPRELKEYLYSGEINPGNKDTLQQLSENMLINLDELENLNRSEIGSLKEMVTKGEIKVRRAYGHHHEKMPRRASFAGSVNTAQFLSDTTGSRRFLCFEVLDIDYQRQTDMGMAYAQALHLYRTGFRFWFDREEIQAVTASNERFQVRTVEEELLLSWFEKAGEGEKALFLTTSQLVARLAEKAKIGVTDASANKLGKALRKHGFGRVKRGGSYGYLVRELTWDEVEANSQQRPQEVPGRPQEVTPPF